MMTNKLKPAVGKVYKNKNQKTGKSYLVIRLVPEELTAQAGTLENLTEFSIFINQVESKFDNNFVGYATLVKNQAPAATATGTATTTTTRTGTTTPTRAAATGTFRRAAVTAAEEAPAKRRFTSLLDE